MTASYNIKMSDDNLIELLNEANATPPPPTTTTVKLAREPFADIENRQQDESVLIQM
ncbi:unnamed protein product, partial [Didymodactylos carnosus]